MFLKNLDRESLAYSLSHDIFLTSAIEMPGEYPTRIREDILKSNEKINSQIDERDSLFSSKPAHFDKTTGLPHSQGFF